MAISERYYNEFETISECYHTWPDGETAFYSYKPEKYHGRVKKCSLCKKKRILDTTEEGPIGYIEQADLWSVSYETKTEKKT